MKDIIKARHLALGLSQENLARQLGVKRTTVSQWEAGRNTPKTKEEKQNDYSISCGNYGHMRGRMVDLLDRICRSSKIYNG